MPTPEMLELIKKDEWTRDEGVEQQRVREKYYRECVRILGYDPRANDNKKAGGSRYTGGKVIDDVMKNLLFNK